MRMTRMNVAQPLWSRIVLNEEGKREAIEVKINSDMPLPMPRSVISSPIHMITPVPAVMVRTMIRIVGRLLSGMMLVHEAPNRLDGLRAAVTSVEDCRIARPMVRYRVY